MKNITVIIMVLLTVSCQRQEREIHHFELSTSPAVDTAKNENREIISIAESFFKTKNHSLKENKYWLISDFERYTYPYLDIYKIEKGFKGDFTYKPILMELIDIDAQSKLLKVGFVGYNEKLSESTIRAIYNFIATRSKSDKWYFKRATDYYTQDWKRQKEKSLTYILPEGKIANQQEIEKQASEIEQLCAFFDCEPIEITYYSCNNPRQVFEVMGFDYLPSMYFSRVGGRADPYGKIIYSGNNSEYYTHEIVHIYTKKLFPNIKGFLDEGIATYIGGSGKFGYQWHRDKMSNYLKDSNINLAEHLEPYEKLYVEDKTPVPYMIGALICERTNRIYGKDKLFELLNSEKDIWNLLGDVGLTKENLTKELKNELKLTTTVYMKS